MADHNNNSNTNAANTNKSADATKQQQPQSSSTSPPDEFLHHHHHQELPILPPASSTGAVSAAAVVAHFISGGPPFEPPPLAAVPQQQFDSASAKRARYNTNPWKLVTSPTAQSPSPTAQPQLPLAATATGAGSSSDTTSSPSPSPRLPGAKAHETGSGSSRLQEGELQQIPQHQHQQFRKGKYVSPVWKPNEMLWLARAWRVQYQGGSVGIGPDGPGQNEVLGPVVTGGGAQVAVATVGGGGGRGKTRAEKDREVAEYLKRHGVNRDAKTAGTKWDNMLGEFRKVYEWERGGEREQVGKSYFRLSPYERKLHRLPASFDEEVFEELSQFMGSRMRSSSSSLPSDSPRVILSPSITPSSDHYHHHDARGASALPSLKALPPPPREDDISLSGKARHMIMGGEGEAYLHTTRGTLLGFDSPIETAVPSSSSSSLKELRRIGRIRMTWEESVSLWAEEGEHHRGRVKLHGSSFLNADEITYFDDSMVACTLEAFEDGPLKAFSVDRFVSGQQIKVFGRRKSFSSAAPSVSATSPCEFPDPTEYYVGCLRFPPPTLPNLFDLSWHIQEPPPEDLRLPLRRDIYRDLPQGKELFFTTSNEFLDCRSFTIDILGSLIRSTPSITASTAMTRESFIGLWDDCINRVIAKFCAIEMVFIRKPSSSLSESLQDQWPNLTGFVRNFCLWRGEETDQVRDGHLVPSSTIAEKILWTYMDLPYLLGYYAIGHVVTFCALSRSQERVDRIIRTDLYPIDLSNPTERLKALVPCWRIAGLLALLADRCVNIGNGGGGDYGRPLPYSDFDRIDLGNGNIVEMTPNTVTKYYTSKRKWAAVKEIYDSLDRRIPHAEYVFQAAERDLALVFKPRGCKKTRPTNVEQLVEALKHVTEALVALHDLSFMHRDLSWDKVTRGCEGVENSSGTSSEWFLCGFEEAVGAPRIYPHGGGGGGGMVESGRHAPEMGRGVHGVKVDVWGVGHLLKTCGLMAVPKALRELQNRCLEQNPEQRPTAADCYHHLLQFQSSSSLSAAAAAAAATGGGSY